MTQQIVRPLEIYELPVCLPFGEAFFKELELPDEFNPDHFLKNWQTFLSSYKAIIFSLWQDDRAIGGLGGMISPDVFTGKLIAQEFFWYVEPEFRVFPSAVGAFRLIREFKTWGKENGAVRMRMVHMMGKTEDRMDGLYRQLGGRPIEVGYDFPL